MMRAILPSTVGFSVARFQRTTCIAQQPRPSPGTLLRLLNSNPQGTIAMLELPLHQPPSWMAWALKLQGLEMPRQWPTVVLEIVGCPAAALE